MGWTLQNVQVNSSGGSSVNSIAAPAFTNPLTPGSIIIVGIGQSSGTNTYSVTDTALNNYVDCGVGVIRFAGTTTSFQVFYAINNSSTASNIVTAHSSGAATFFFITPEEWTGNNVSGPIDAFAGSVTNATTSGTGPDNEFTSAANTSFNGDLIYCAETASNNSVSAGTNFTADSTSSGVKTEHLIQSSAGSTTGTWSNTLSANAYACIMVAVRPPLIYMLGHT